MFDVAWNVELFCSCSSCAKAPVAPTQELAELKAISVRPDLPSDKSCVAPQKAVAESKTISVLNPLPSVQINAVDGGRAR